MTASGGDQPDYALLDRAGAATYIFYPRPDWTPAPAGAQDHMVDVEPGIAVACRTYLADHVFPSVLLFHGNGEVASDYDQLAPLYHHNELNLVVADYRGYGRSAGIPTVASLVSDAHRVSAWFHERLDALGFSKRRLVMGRSLGTHPALELAANGDGYEALVIESGAARLDRLIQMFMPSATSTVEASRLIEGHNAKVARIRIPTLIIHGAEDDMIPLETAAALYDALQVERKQLVVIPDAGHNDIWAVGWRQYFEALHDFVHGPKA